MCKWYCTSSGPCTNLACLNCGCHYCAACLHGEAGKMESLVKCAKCGKKPTVKSNADRGGWKATCNPPCNEGGGPRYDCDDGVANSVFTSGLRANGAAESNEAAARRTAGSSRGLVGPERFFYDKSTFTGTHAKGGPERIAKGCGTAACQSWKRPDSVLDDVPINITRPRDVGPTLLRSSPVGTKVRSGSHGAVASIRPTSSCGVRPSSRGATRPSSRGAGTRGMVGPERFFYDKSTYTGTHTNGGPSSIAKGGGTSWDQSWKRPN